MMFSTGGSANAKQPQRSGRRLSARQQKKSGNGSLCMQIQIADRENITLTGCRVRSYSAALMADMARPL
jgi:hypothetical protein